MTRRFVILAVAIGFVMAASVWAEENVRGGWAEDNVRTVQQKLRDAGFYAGEIDGAYSSELAMALTRYQIRNGLPITGQLDSETSKALGAKPAVATSADDRANSSEVWRRLRTGNGETIASAQKTSPPPGNETMTSTTGVVAPQKSHQLSSPTTENAKPASPPVATKVSDERLRDYVAAFVLAGLDPHVGSEADFFADRVHYYDSGLMNREKIRQDLQRYAARWPQRQFWLDGNITVERENGDLVRLTFPLRYELRNGAKHSSGKINKTLVLHQTGDDLEIVAVNERKAG